MICCGELTEKEKLYLEETMRVVSEKGNCKELGILCRQAYNDYRAGLISEKVYSKIYAICMECANPR